MKNIAITGVSGYIGTRLLSRLDGIDSVQKIIGIDVKEPEFKSAKLKFYRQDILKPFGDLFDENEDDLIKVIETLLAQKKGGVFNVAGEGDLRYSEVAGLVGKRLLRLPDRVLKFLIRMSWALRLQNESPVSGLEFVKYPPVVSTDKLAREVGFRFQHSTEEALSSFVSAVRNR